MTYSNFERMIQLAEDVFDAKNDPDQLDVDEQVLERLKKIHPATVSEYDDGDGPVAWVLLIPTIKELMQQFLSNKISEKELFELTPLESSYDALYLCSALVLEEYRRKGIAKKLTLDAIEQIRKAHPIQSLFAWAFTKEGQIGVDSIAKATSLPLFNKESL